MPRGQGSERPPIHDVVATKIKTKTAFFAPSTFFVRGTRRWFVFQPLNMVGWVPLHSCEYSDWGSMDSEEKADLDGDEIIELLDPVEGDVISPESVSPRNR